MPASPDDDIFKRMFASFVARKTRNSGPNVRPPSSSPIGEHARVPPSRPTESPIPQLDRPGADKLRKVATDYHGRGFNGPTSSAYPQSNYRHGIPSIQRVPHQSHHQYAHTSQFQRTAPDGRQDPPVQHQHVAHHHQRTSVFPSLFPGRPSPEDAHGQRVHPNPNAHEVPASSRRQAGVRSRGRILANGGSRGSKGSKGSEKQVSASTEDAPPRKRTRTHPLPNLHRSQSAHAGSIHSSRNSNSKGDKPRMNSRFNLPSVQPPTGFTTTPNSGSNAHSPPQQQRVERERPAGAKSFPCDQCSAVFAQKGQLSRHTRRVHEKLRPYACDYCGRLFGARSDRTRHVMVSLSVPSTF